MVTCGRIVIFSLSSCSSNLEISTPSIRMVPEVASISLNSDNTSDDLPAPVRPTMPT